MGQGVSSAKRIGAERRQWREASQIAGAKRKNAGRNHPRRFLQRWGLAPPWVHDTGAGRF
ncbi:hypothetical protein C8R44DRAFT_760742 [Mycena epipterygia]|nr:hypothetical protein C8R44DRAFT_760742 [Mycena epipterygia]